MPTKTRRMDRSTSPWNIPADTHQVGWGKGLWIPAAARMTGDNRKTLPQDRAGHGDGHPGGGAEYVPGGYVDGVGVLARPVVQGCRGSNADLPRGLVDGEESGIGAAQGVGQAVVGGVRCRSPEMPLQTAPIKSATVALWSEDNFAQKSILSVEAYRLCFLTMSVGKGTNGFPAAGFTSVRGLILCSGFVLI